MPAAQPVYDLVLLLDSSADESRRADILKSVQAAVKKGGEVVNEQDWGARSLAYEIGHRKDADYHLMQFHGAPELLAQLDRTLRITDEVVRFRIIKLAPGTPAPPESRPEPRPSAGAAAEGDGADAAPVTADEPAATPAEAQEPEPVAVPAGDAGPAEPEAEDTSAAEA